MRASVSVKLSWFWETMNGSKYESIGGVDHPCAENNEKSGEDENSVCSSKRNYKIKRWMGVRRSTWLLSLYVIAYFIYLVGGCLLFTFIEQGVEQEIKSRIDLRKKQFAFKYPDVNPEDLEDLIDNIMFRGISPKMKDIDNSNWSFGQSFLFTVTVVTTVGESVSIISLLRSMRIFSKRLA